MPNSFVYLSCIQIALDPYCSSSASDLARSSILATISSTGLISPFPRGKSPSWICHVAVGAESKLTAEIEDLALQIPNLTSEQTPRGDEALVLSYINDHPEPRPAESDRVWRSHVHIGSELGLLDFAGAANASGWGWYYLLDEGAQLEQALINFALTVAT